MGLRIALERQRRDILRSVLRYTASSIPAGVGLGFLRTFAWDKVIASQLFGISPPDPATLALGMLLVVLTPPVACYVLAWRAAPRSHGGVAVRVRGEWSGRGGW
jgi:hypothetical protein